MNIDLSKTQKFLDWLKIVLYLDSISPNSSKRYVKRGEVYWYHVGYNIGCETSKTHVRPCVIVQTNIANPTSGNVIICPITHNKSTLPCMIPITPILDTNGKIILDGSVNTSHIMSVSKARLTTKITNGTLDSGLMKNIDESIAKQVDIYHYYDKLKRKYNKLIIRTNRLKDSRDKKSKEIAKIRTLLGTKSYNETEQKIIKLLDNGSDL